MARATGTIPYGKNFEVQTPAPLDARSLVATKADLINPATWIVAPSTQAYTYTGMLVVVASDPTATNNGIYMLKNRTAWADAEQWTKLSNETVFSITGLNITGLYNETPDHVYMKADVASIAGSLYYCLVDNTSNIKPTVTTDWQLNWALFQLKGSEGAAGATPTIGNNGNWFINGTDTTKQAIGTNGLTPTIQDGFWYIGEQRLNKATGTTITISNDGYWVLDGVKSNTLAVGIQGQSAIANINYLGAYKPNTQYYKSDRTGKTDVVIGSDGTMYAALVDSKNIDPVSDTLHNTWAVFSMKGTDGKQGDTPYIKEGYWWIGTERKDVKAAGDVLSISSDGFWQINGVTTDKKAVPENGQNGTNGTNGTNGENAVANINVRGPWQTGQTYLHLNVDGTTDVVLGSNGTSYFCLQDTSIDPTTDTTHTYWAQFSMAGSPGITPHIELDPDGEYRWYIGTQNQNIIAQGKNGQNGTNGRNASQPYITEQGFWGYKLLMPDGTYQYNTTTVVAEGLTPYIKEGFWWIGNRNTGVQAIGQSAIANLNYLGEWLAGTPYYHVNPTASNWTDVVLGKDENSYYCKANNTDKNPCKLVGETWVRDEANAQYWAKFVMKGTATDGRNIELRRNEGWIQWRVVGEGNDQWKNLLETKTLVSKELSDISTPIGTKIDYYGQPNNIPVGYLNCDGRTIFKEKSTRSYIVNSSEPYQGGGIYKYRLYGDGFSYNADYQPQIGERIDYNGKVAYVTKIYPTGGYYVIGTSVTDLPISSAISITKELVYPELVEVLTGSNIATSAKLPNEKGRFSVGYDENDTDYNSVGETGGVKSVRLTSKQSALVEHDHLESISSNSGSGKKAIHNSNLIGTSDQYRSQVKTGKESQSLAEESHENRPPYIVCLKIIKASYQGEIRTPYDTYLQTVPEGTTPLSREEWLETMRGETGVAGFNYRYDYVNSDTYNENDVVRSLVDGNAYYCKVDGTTLKEPSTNPTEWTIFVMRGAQGAAAPQVLIRYSTSSSTAEGSDWHAIPTLIDVYARFSTDNGANYGSPIKFKGETGASAYPIKIQYSETGLAGSWSETATATSKYLQFSTDNGTTWSSTISISGGSSVFTENIKVNLSSGKFGKYSSGQTIIAANKTFEEVLRDIAIESIAPIASITASRIGGIPYNHPLTADSDYAAYADTKVTLNLTASSQNGGSINKYEIWYRRVGQSDSSWVSILNTGTATSNIEHSVKALLGADNVTGIEYKFKATDTVGATKEVTASITPNVYTPALYAKGTPAYSLTREIGNVSTRIVGTISFDTLQRIGVSQYASITSRTLYYRINADTAWTAISAGTLTNNIDYTHDNIALKDAYKIEYQLVVVSTKPSGATHTATFSTTDLGGTINLNYNWYYGVGTAAPTAATDALRRDAVKNSNPLVSATGTSGTSGFPYLYTGTSAKIWICLPPGRTLSLTAYDVSANANFVFGTGTTYLMNDAGGNQRSFTMYEATSGFSTSHQIRITIS